MRGSRAKMLERVARDSEPERHRGCAHCTQGSPHVPAKHHAFCWRSMYRFLKRQNRRGGQ